MVDVSRETLDAASSLFPADRLELLAEYAESLATEATVRGLIGPREGPRLWDRHLLNCALVGEIIPAGATACDVGSGAGLPGIVMAIARPDIRLTLVEPLLRRTNYLDEVVEQLGLDNVHVHRGKADTLHGAATYDVVTSRAVARLEKLIPWCMPLVEPVGVMLALKGSSAQDEVDESRALLHKWKCADPFIETLGEGIVHEPTTVVGIAWADPSNVGAPPHTENKQSSQRTRKGRK